MKFDIKLQTDPESHNHRVELATSDVSPPAEGPLQFVLDGEAGKSDWVEIAPGVYSILLDGRSHEVLVTARSGDQSARVTSYDVTARQRRYHLELRDPRLRRPSGPEGVHQGPQEVMAPMPGRIVKILVRENQEVNQGEGLLVIEAMKMQNELRASRPGRVEKIYVSEGAGVEMGFKLLRLA